MSAEIENFSEGGAPRPGKRCKYCARIMVSELKKPEDLLPDEATEHCALLACNWCRPCARGETTVSPAHRPPEAA